MGSGPLRFCLLETDETTSSGQVLVHGPYDQSTARAKIAQFAVVLRVRWRDDRELSMDLELDHDLLKIKEDGTVVRQFKVQPMFASRRLL